MRSSSHDENCNYDETKESEGFAAEITEDDILSNHAGDNSLAIEKHNDVPLFNGSPLTVASAMVMIFTFSIWFSLSADAMSYLLLLIYVLMPPGTRTCKTLYQCKELFSSMDSPMKYHLFCGTCFTNIENSKIETCPNKQCLADLTTEQSKGYFIEFPIIHQLQSLFARPGFYSSLQYRFSHKKKC